MKDVLVRWNLRLDALENRGCDSSKSEKKFPFLKVKATASSAVKV